MDTNFHFTAIFEPLQQGGFMGYIKEVSGINTQGETLEEVKENMIDAIDLYFAEKIENFRKEIHNIPDSTQQVLRLV